MNTDHAKRVTKKLGCGLLLALLMIVLGAMLGYAIGGGNPWAVFDPETWQHIFDFLK
ncbi:MULTISPECIES: DNA-directed RNA polymerase subunit beta [Lacticaseibacillus]|uniref:DNA-directed RNA polymerase subunit beta n=2 Tax=Lacticaseibacillus TaxID=2759736 RepID=A0ABW4CIY3_9LACO|nr:MULTISPECIES: DNA-directed RNA polymerase subunit beta [Lacticaseibacillus]